MPPERPLTFRLGTTEFCLRLPIVARVFDGHPIGASGQRFQTHVETDALGIRRKVCGLKLDRETGIPAPRFPTNGQRFYLANNFAVLLDLEVADFREL